MHTLIVCDVERAIIFIYPKIVRGCSPLDLNENFDQAQNVLNSTTTLPLPPTASLRATATSTSHNPPTSSRSSATTCQSRTALSSRYKVTHSILSICLFTNKDYCEKMYFFKFPIKVNVSCFKGVLGPAHLWVGMSDSILVSLKFQK